MTYFAIERVLWGISQNPDEAAAFSADSARYLGGFNLAADERDAISSFNVRALADAGVSPLLLMQSWNAVAGPDNIPEYLARMSGFSGIPDEEPDNGNG